MGRKEKLKERILSAPSDLRWTELVRFLTNIGYTAEKTGTTGGSRRHFFDDKTNHAITMHEPHGSDAVKVGAIKNILKNLKDAGKI